MREDEQSDTPEQQDEPRFALLHQTYVPAPKKPWWILGFVFIIVIFLIVVMHAMGHPKRRAASIYLALCPTVLIDLHPMSEDNTIYEATCLGRTVFMKCDADGLCKKQKRWHSGSNPADVQIK